jgi:hypothetical protein
MKSRRTHNDRTHRALQTPMRPCPAQQCTPGSVLHNVAGSGWIEDRRCHVAAGGTSASAAACAVAVADPGQARPPVQYSREEGAGGVIS